MASHNIRINPYTLQNLYTTNLVSLSKPNAAKKYLGENTEQLVVVNNEPKGKYIADADYALLTQILKACNINILNCAIVNYHTQQQDITTLIEQLNPKKVLLFGVSTLQIKLPITFAPNHVQYYNEIAYLHTNDIATIAVNKNAKMELWASLKQLYSI